MQDHDPYQPSAAALSERPPQPLVIESTTKVRRFFNWVIDHAVTWAAQNVLLWAAVVIGGEPMAGWIVGMGWWTVYALVSILYVGYYTLMEGAFGLTLGKLATNTRVVDAYGQPPGFRRAFLRSLCRLIPLNPFSLLLSDDDVRRGWHDHLPRCYVIHRPRAGQPAGQPQRTASEAAATLVPGTATANDLPSA